MILIQSKAIARKPRYKSYHNAVTTLIISSDYMPLYDHPSDPIKSY